jgi:hypothetical protein
MLETRRFWILEYLHMQNKLSWGLDPSLNMKFNLCYIPYTHSLKGILNNILVGLGYSLVVEHLLSIHEALGTQSPASGSLEQQKRGRERGEYVGLKYQLLYRWRQENHEFKTSPGKVSKILSQNQNKNKRTGNVAQVVECLPSMYKALDSLPKSEPEPKNKKLVLMVCWGDGMVKEDSGATARLWQVGVLILFLSEVRCSEVRCSELKSQQILLLA